MPRSAGSGDSSSPLEYEAPALRRIRRRLMRMYRGSLSPDDRLAALDDAYLYARDTFNGGRPFPSSFYYVSTLYLNNAARRAKERAERERVVARVHPGMPAPSTPCPRLAEAMRLLPDDEAETVRMTFAGGMTLKEIGDIQDCSRETVRRRLKSALRHLRDLCS